MGIYPENESLNKMTFSILYDSAAGWVAYRGVEGNENWEIQATIFGIFMALILFLLILYTIRS
jgi:hypothetical protein